MDEGPNHLRAAAESNPFLAVIRTNELVVSSNLLYNNKKQSLRVSTLIGFVPIYRYTLLLYLFAYK
jgi:hypothetical protein